MHVSMYLCIYVCIRTYIYMCICIYVYIYDKIGEEHQRDSDIPIGISFPSL